jgi:hypothetical protein
MVSKTKEPVATKTLTSSTTVTEDDDVPVSMEFLNDRPGDYLTTSDSGSLFVQNEEQKEINRWSETVAITHDEYVAKSAKRKGKS